MHVQWKYAWRLCDTKYLSNHARYRVGFKRPPIRNYTASPVVTWPMTLRDPKTARSLPKIFETSYLDNRARDGWFNPSPGNGFCDVCRQRGGGKITPRHISSSKAHSDKIPTATPMFPGSSFLVVVLPISRDIDVCYPRWQPINQKVLISLKLWHISSKFQRQTYGIRPCQTRRKCT